jgi:hypothetical protein
MWMYNWPCYPRFDLEPQQLPQQGRLPTRSQITQQFQEKQKFQRLYNKSTKMLNYDFIWL